MDLLARDPSEEHNTRVVVQIGCGGIWEGYGLTVPSLHRTGELAIRMLMLVDGDTFEDRNAGRQAYHRLGPKAVVRKEQLLALYPEPGFPLVVVGSYICRANVGNLISERSIVLLSPDNHPTRRLVSDHVKGLEDCLLIVGGNDGIEEEAGKDGTEGVVMVHYRKEGQDLTAPIDLFHPEIAQDAGPEPTEQSCGELAAGGAIQIRRTNLLVGQWMLNMLLRYTQLPADEAVRVSEVAMSSRTHNVVLYERRPDAA